MNREFRLLKTILLIVCVFVTIIFYSDIGKCALLGVNRVGLTYNDVLRGGYAEDNVIVTIGSEESIPVFYEAKGDIADWIRFNPLEGPMLVNANNNGKLKIIVEPPSDARVGKYIGKVLITTGSLGQVESSMGTNVEVAFEVKIEVIVSDTQILSCNSGGFEIKDSEIGDPVEFSATVLNNGNVRIKPLIEFRIFDQFQENELLKTTYLAKDEVLPTTSKEITDMLELNLSEGQYWIEMICPECSGDGSLMTFSILEKGGISDVGEFVKFENEAWANTGELIPITAYFRNRGERSVLAQFKGTISKDGKIVQLLESDSITVAPQDTVPIEMFFKPDEMGQYKINGRFFYNNKITFQKGSVININPSSSSKNQNNEILLSIVFTIIIIVIAFLLFLIIRKKRKKN